MSENTEKTDYLEVDNPIPGQNYVCLSFISPENTLTEKQLFMFNKYMTQRCGEFENKIDDIIQKSSDELKDSIKEELLSVLKTNMKYNYKEFKSEFDDFKYKYAAPLQKQFDNHSEFKTSVRGVKVRGVYDSYQEAQNKAKELQRKDRSFHVFLGQVGYWLPWDPCADKVENEEYLEDELNTMMQKYKENEIARDLLYEEDKRDKMKAAMKEKLEAEQKQKEIQDNLEEEDPWLKSKFTDTADAYVESSEVVVEKAENADTNTNTNTNTNTEQTDSNVNNTNDEVKEV